MFGGANITFNISYMRCEASAECDLYLEGMPIAGFAHTRPVARRWQ